MPKEELGGIPIDSYKDLELLQNTSEREYARFLLSKENLSVFYESTRFKNKKTGNSSLPDFKLINLTSGKESYIEVTTSPYYEEFSDPKEKQKRIIEEVSEEIGENILYIVLYAQQLEKIDDLNPELGLDFFRDRSDYSPK